MKSFFLLRFIIYLFIIWSSAFQLFAAPLVVFSDKNTKLSIGDKIMILEDPENSFTLNEVISNTNFKVFPNTVPNLGTTNSAFWIKVEIKNESNIENLLLELSQPNLDLVEFFDPSDIHRLSRKTGEGLPFNTREYQEPNYIFDVRIPQNFTKVFFLKVKSTEIIQLPFFLGTSQSIFESAKTRDFLSGIYYGIMLVMILYNLFIYFTVRDTSYLYYVLYIVMVLLTQATLQGYSYQYLWPDFPWLALHSNFIFPCFVGTAGMAFMMYFLKARSFVSPLVVKISYLFYFSYSFALLLSFLGFYVISHTAIQINAMSISIFMLYVPIVIIKKGFRPARYFLIAWVVFLIGVCIFVSKDLGALPYNNFTRYVMQIGSGLETILLSFALADRIKILQKEKEQSQHEALIAMEEKQRLIKEQNITLDIKVKERTEELETTLKDLKETQSQLVNAEKMASLGQLTAGVAHEINNPINFVSSSIKPLKRDINDLLSVLSKYDEVDESNFKNKVVEIKDLKIQMDLEYVKEEINTLLNGIEEGAARTAEIVKGLKTFSRLDETDLKRVDINEGIDSTLVLLSSIMRGNIEVKKEYGKIPKIECYAGKLNQVFMNILNNAIHAVLKKHSNGNGGQIRIKTIENGDFIDVCIRDNGTGISDKFKSKIFDPFFTTKEVGEGTGLGLSIVYNIIESHKGKVIVESEMGEGTEFIITLPKLQTN